MEQIKGRREETVQATPPVKGTEAEGREGPWLRRTSSAASSIIALGAPLTVNMLLNRGLQRCWTYYFGSRILFFEEENSSRASNSSPASVHFSKRINL